MNHPSVVGEKPCETSDQRKASANASREQKAEERERSWRYLLKKEHRICDQATEKAERSQQDDQQACTGNSSQQIHKYFDLFIIVDVGEKRVVSSRVMENRGSG